MNLGVIVTSDTSHLLCWVSRARFTPSDSRYAAMPDQGKLNAAMYLGEAILQLI